MLGRRAVPLRDYGRRGVYLSPWISSNIETSCVYNNYQTLESLQETSKILIRTFLQALLFAYETAVRLVLCGFHSSVARSQVRAPIFPCSILMKVGCA